MLGGGLVCRNVVPLFCLLSNGDLGPLWGLLLCASTGDQSQSISLLRRFSHFLVIILGFADNVLHNPTPRAMGGECWVSMGQQDSVTFFLCLDANHPTATAEPLCCVLVQVSQLNHSLHCSLLQEC